MQTAGRTFWSASESLHTLSVNVSGKLGIGYLRSIDMTSPTKSVTKVTEPLRYHEKAALRPRMLHQYQVQSKSRDSFIEVVLARSALRLGAHNAPVRALSPWLLQAFPPARVSQAQEIFLQDCKFAVKKVFQICTETLQK